MASPSETVIRLALAGQVDKSEQILDQLVLDFGESDQTCALRGLILEARGRPEEAMVMYNEQLQRLEFSPYVWKRKIALLQSQCNVEQAIQELITYLDHFYEDPEAWAELYDIYKAHGSHTGVIFCLQQLTILDPNAYDVLTRLGEAHFALAATQSDKSKGPELVKAFDYFSRSIELCWTYVNAWVGVRQCICKLQALKDKRGLENLPSDNDLRKIKSKSESIIKAAHPDLLGILSKPIA